MLKALMVLVPGCGTHPRTLLSLRLRMAVSSMSDEGDFREHLFYQLEGYYFSEGWGGDRSPLSPNSKNVTDQQQIPGSGDR